MEECKIKMKKNSVGGGGRTKYIKKIRKLNCWVKNWSNEREKILIRERKRVEKTCRTYVMCGE